MVHSTSLQQEEALDLVDPLRHLLNFGNGDADYDHHDPEVLAAKSFHKYVDSNGPSTSKVVANGPASSIPHTNHASISSSQDSAVVMEDIRDAPSSTDYSLVPPQQESIINRKTTIRYFADASKTPQLIDESSITSIGTELTDYASVSHHAEKEGTDFWDIHLKLDMTSGCGGKIWPAAEVLGAYIASKCSPFSAAAKSSTSSSDSSTHSPSIQATSSEASSTTASSSSERDPRFDWRGKTVLELGSGTGLVGILVSLLCIETKVYITDQIPMLPLMQENLQLNPLPSSESCRVEELNWGEDLPDWMRRPSSSSTSSSSSGTTSPAPAPSEYDLPDVLLLADCVYLESAFQPLVDTMNLLSTKNTQILFCYQKRRKADKRFFTLLKKHFTFQNVTDDDPERTKAYTRQGTQLLQVFKK